MNMDSNEFKKRTISDFQLKSLWNILRNTTNGLVHFYKYERSAILHLIASVFMVFGAWLLHFSPIEWLIISMILFMSLAVELINTAIESVCDLITKEYNSYIKVAKDSASAATGVLTFAGMVVVLFLYVPKIIELLKSCR